jgi:hypothetical protein
MGDQGESVIEQESNNCVLLREAEFDWSRKRVVSGGLSMRQRNR